MKRKQTNQAINTSSVSMTPEVVDECIRQLEVKHDLLKYEIDGWCVWPMLRSPAALALMNLPFAKKDQPGLAELLPIVSRDIVGLVSLRRSRYLIKSYASALVEQEGNLYKDIFFDDLLLDMSDFVKIELLNSKGFIQRSRSPLIKSSINLTSFRIMANLLAKIGGLRSIAHLAQIFSSHLQEELAIDVFTPQWVARILHRFYWYKKLYGWLLDRIAPTYLLVADAGEYEITTAAKERQIKVIEFQHGFVSAKHHLVYSWPAYAVAYKAKMPIPDQIFLYGEYWKQELEVNNFWNQEIRLVGSLRLDQYRQRRVAYLGTIKGVTTWTICVTTQGLDIEKLIDFIADFLKTAHEKLDFQLYFKLHPVYETSKVLYEAAFQTDKRVHILLGNESPSTFELLARSHLHLSISSTCHYEALGLGVPTVILPFTTHEVVLHLYEMGHAFLARTPQELLDIILQHQHYEVPAEISALYFKPNALENIKRELGL